MQLTKRIFVFLTAIALTIAVLPAAHAAQAAAPAKKAAAKKGTEKNTGADAKSSHAKVVDINTASAEDLDALPGIGKTRSAAIIKGRPYANKAQLVSKGILPQATYDKIADRIIAKQK